MAREGINIFAGFDLKAFSTSAQNLERRLKKTGRNLQKVGRSITRSITAPVAILGGLAVREFANFEQAMAKVQATTGATADQLSVLTNLSKQLGLTTRFTASEVADLELNYSKLGFSVSDITKITEATLQLSLATGEDLAQSAEVAGQTLRGFNLDASEMQRVVDIMANSFSSSALTLERFSVSMGKIAPVANAAGVTIERVVAMQSALVDSGVEASTVGTSLRKIFIELATGGLSYEQAMQKIRNATNKVAVANELFGNRAFAAAIILSDQQTKVDELTMSYENSGGAAKKMADIMDDTLQGSLFKVKSAVEGLAISFGEILSPVVKKIGGKIASLARMFSQLSPTVKKMALVMAGLIAIAGPVLLLIGGLTIAFAALATATNLAALPIIAIIATIAVLGAANIWLKDNALALALTFHNVWVSIKNGVIEAVKGILFIYKKLADALGLDIGQKVFDFLDTLKDDKIPKAAIQFTSFKETATKAMKGVTESLGLATTGAENFGNGVKKVTNEVVKDLDKLNIAFRRSLPFRELLAFITNIGKAQRLLRGFSKVEFQIKAPVIDVSSLADQVGKLITKLDEVKSVAAAKAKEIGVSISQALNDGLKLLISDAAVLIGQFLGNALAGSGATLKDFGNELLGLVGNFMSDFGKAMIATGVGMLALDLAIKSLNPALAIAGGIALVAAGAAISSLSKKGIQGGGGGGGFNTGSSGGGGFNTGLGTITTETVLSGREIIIVQQREKGFRR